jgi:hypothetical protein
MFWTFGTPSSSSSPVLITMIRSKLPILITSIIIIVLVWHISLKDAYSKEDCTRMASDTASGREFPVGIGFDLTAFYGYRFPMPSV